MSNNDCIAFFNQISAFILGIADFALQRKHQSYQLIS